MISRYILLNNFARVQTNEEKVSLVFAAATLATVEGPLEPPVVHHLAIHAQLQTDALLSSNIPAERTRGILRPLEDQMLLTPDLSCHKDTAQSTL